MSSSLSVRIGSLELKNPVVAASGTFGYGEEFEEDIYDISRLGAVVTKGISLKPREGNPMPRTIETRAGMLNAIGLANVGVDAFLSDKLPRLLEARATVIVNIFGFSVSEYASVAERMGDACGVSAVEVNVSCPNVGREGVQFGTDPKAVAKVTKAVRKSFPRTLIVKLSPQVSDISVIAKSVEDAGADAVSLINTVPAMAIDVRSRRPALANVTGGLSGPAIKPIALKLVYDVAKAVGIPVIGLGGIESSDDAIEFMLAGASAIQVGTMNFVRPGVAIEIIDGLSAYCEENGLSSIGEIVGAVEVRPLCRNA